MILSLNQIYFTFFLTGGTFWLKSEPTLTNIRTRTELPRRRSLRSRAPQKNVLRYPDFARARFFILIRMRTFFCGSLPSTIRAGGGASDGSQAKSFPPNPLHFLPARFVRRGKDIILLLLQESQFVVVVR